MLLAGRKVRPGDRIWVIHPPYAREVLNPRLWEEFPITGYLPQKNHMVWGQHCEWVTHLPFSYSITHLPFSYEHHTHYDELYHTPISPLIRRTILIMFPCFHQTGEDMYLPPEERGTPSLERRRTPSLAEKRRKDHTLPPDERRYVKFPPDEKRYVPQAPRQSRCYPSMERIFPTYPGTELTPTEQ